MQRLKIAEYKLNPKGWPHKQKLRIAALSDFHFCRPWMDEKRGREICARANAFKPDIILLLGDYATGMSALASDIPVEEWAAVLGTLDAPLGVHAVFGNHDWLEDPAAQARGAGPLVAREVLQDNGISVYENEVTELEIDGQAFWLAGLADQRAFEHKDDEGWRQRIGLDDLEGTLSQISNDAPVILMAHEPDIFPRVPNRVSLTLSGHTHGGQVSLFGFTPVVPSDYGSRYVYGHIQEGGRDMIVTSGLGCSRLPIRIGVPPEIVLIELG